MSFPEAPQPADAASPVATLASRRPGHAAMTYVLREMARRGVDPRPGASVPADLHSWHLGVAGEHIVGQELALLPQGWHVLHAVPAGSRGADIDHLVIGPGGVFVLNTKHHAARSISVGTHVVWINGHPTNNYQRDLVSRCDQVRQVLGQSDDQSIPVYPMLVFVRPTSITLRGTQHVHSVNSMALVAWLISRPRVLEPEAVQDLVRKAESPSTWGAPNECANEPDPTLQFLSLSLSREPLLPVSAPVRTATAVPRTRIAARRRGFSTVIAALGLSLVVLPMIVALIVTLLGVFVQALIGF